MTAGLHEAGADLPRPMFAHIYAALIPRMDAGGLAGLRDELLAGLSGSVVEVGCGNGMNFRHYPQSVTHVHAVEPEPHLRALAVEAAADVAVDVAVTAGTGDSLPLEDGSVDAAVVCMVLCSVPDQEAAVAEIRRVVRPGGTLVFLEHVASKQPAIARFQKVADATLWPRVAGGCHLGHDTLAALTAGGFVVEAVRTPEHPGGIGGALAPHILGRAHRG
ncbi:MAG: class I SAM-dependent methyltransferase [Arachnia sp.]